MVSKWYVLFLACVVTFGGYFSFDTPSVLHNQFARHFSSRGEIDFEFEFSLIYAIYSLPNTFLPFVGGYMADIFGNRVVLMVFGVLVLLGNIIMTAACQWELINVYIFGRFVFGLGLESLGVVAGVIIAKWFLDQELALALGINLSVCKAGNVLSDWIVPEFHRRFGLVLTQYFVTFLCLLSFISLLYLIECEDVPTCNSLDNSNSSINNSPLGLVLADSPVPGNSDKKEDNVSEDNNSTKSMSTIDIEKEISLIREKESSPLLGITNSSYDNTNNKPPSYRNTEISFSLTVWLLFCFTFLMSGILLPFTNISNSLILELYYPTAESESVQHQHEIFAARLQSVPYLLSIFLAPILGVTVDWFGHRSGQLFFSSILVVVGHSLMIHRLSGAIVPLAMIGLSYSVFASVIWPCVPVIVNEELHGTAYGIMTAAQNTAQFLVPFVLQRIYKNNNTYVPCEIFFLCCSISATLLAFGMLISDEFFNSAIMRRKTSGSFKEFQPVANDSTHSNIDSNQNIELTSKSLGISLQQLEVTNRKSYGTTTNHV